MPRQAYSILQKVVEKLLGLKSVELLRLVYNVPSVTILLHWNQQLVSMAFVSLLKGGHCSYGATNEAT